MLKNSVDSHLSLFRFSNEILSQYIYLSHILASSTPHIATWHHGTLLLQHQSCFISISFGFNYSYERQTKLAGSLVNFWAHGKSSA